MPIIVHNYEKYNTVDPWRDCPKSGDSGVWSLRKTPREIQCCISFWLFLIICGFIYIIFYIYFEIVCARMYWSMLAILFFTVLDKCLSINKINY